MKKRKSNNRIRKIVSRKHVSIKITVRLSDVLPSITSFLRAIGKLFGDD